MELDEKRIERLWSHCIKIHTEAQLDEKRIESRMLLPVERDYYFASLDEKRIESALRSGVHGHFQQLSSMKRGLKVPSFQLLTL